MNNEENVTAEISDNEENLTAEISDNEENLTAEEKRRFNFSASENDLLVRAINIPVTDYECVAVNSPWYEKGLLEGDLILFQSRSDPDPGDIVLIEEDEQTRLGVASTYGFLETAIGRRPLEASERIVGVGVALARRLAAADKE